MTPEATLIDRARGGGLRGLAARMDHVFGRTVELMAAALLLGEIVILGSGVVSRYAFNAPLVWTDEIGSMLFLWLSMLGAVIAFRRGEHMRMTGVVSRVGPRVRSLLDTVAVTAALLFLLLILSPALDFAQDESFVVTPALEINGAWSAAALPTGVILMAVAAVVRLLRIRQMRVVAAAAVITVAAAAAFWAAGPLLAPLDKLNLLVFFVGVVGVNVFAGVPIAFSFALATFGYLSLTTATPMSAMVGRLNEGMSHLILLAIPLFIFLGALIEMTGMARAMIHFLASLLGRVRGGLSFVLIGAMYLVSGISGSKIADMAAIAPVLLPEMRERGAKPGDLLALLAATGAQTETVPPSIVLITIGSVTGVSIAALFTGGLLPAVVLGAGLCSVTWWRNRGEDVSGVPRPALGQILRSGMAPDAMAAELDPVGRFFAGLGTSVTRSFPELSGGGIMAHPDDSAPLIGSIGVAIRCLQRHAGSSLVPIVGGQPNIGRYCAFSTLFAAAAVGGAVHRLDRHPTMAHHPVTPMQEADLRRHLEAHGLERVGGLHAPDYEHGIAWAEARLQTLASGCSAVLFDLTRQSELPLLGELIWRRAVAEPLIAVGPSSVAQAILAHWAPTPPPGPADGLSAAAGPVLALVGSLSPVSRAQVAASPPFEHLELDASRDGDAGPAFERTIALLRRGRSVMVRTASDRTAHRPDQVARATARFVRAVVARARPARIGIAGGDTSSQAALALGAWGLSYRRTLDPGVTLCRIHGGPDELDGTELMLKGGQMGRPDLFERLLHGSVETSGSRCASPVG